MTDSIRIKVRKLLAMAADAGASDNEKAFAMRKAQQLIEEHNIILGEEADADSIEVVKGGRFGVGLKYPYHRVVAQQVAYLYDCRHMFWSNGRDGHAFWGMSHQVEAAEETFVWVIAQIEDLYRIALKAFDGGLGKSQRAELRSSFKDACAAKVAQRIHDIIAQRDQTGRHSRALVVVETATHKVDEMIKAENVKTKKLPALRQGFGTIAGYNAGDQVQIQKGVQH